MEKTDPFLGHNTLNSAASLLVQAITARGLDIDAFAAELGVRLSDYENPNGRVPVSIMQRAWKLAVDWTGDPCFGITLAEVLQPAALHGLGLSMIASSTLKESIIRVVRYQKIISTILNMRLDTGREGYSISSSTKHFTVKPVPTAIDAMTAILVQMCRITAGQRISPQRVDFDHPEAGCRRRFEEFFGCPVRFSASNNRILFDRETLEQELLSANPELARVNDRIVLDYLHDFNRKSLTTRVRELIIELLPGGLPREADVARHLNMSLRSLQRRLKEEGVSYKRILDEIRESLAIRYLEERRRPIIEISYLLGFSEQSNFTRAFKRWQGVTPLQYRQAQPSF